MCDHQCFFATLLLFCVIPLLTGMLPDDNLTSDHYPHENSGGCHDPASIERHSRWAEAALNFVTSMSCEVPLFTSEPSCRLLQKTDREDTVVYVADGTPVSAPLVAILPDKGLSRTGPHDAILTLDPFPRASFGHLVLVFYIDQGVAPDKCEEQGLGVFLDDTGECIQLALKHRCRNLLERRGRQRHIARKCQINFIPLVQVQGLPFHQSEQLLQCQSLPGFAPCPKLRPKKETSKILCDLIGTNNHRCDIPGQQSQCRLFQSCDHAVLINGGWNQQSSPPHEMKAIMDMRQTLIKFGFHSQLIQTFYANGHLAEQNNLRPEMIPPSVIPPNTTMENSTLSLSEERPINETSNDIPTEQTEGDKVPASMYPALKSLLRAKMHHLCSAPHCVDTLFLYLAGPTNADGVLLLWDRDHNGLMDSSEGYTSKELLKDLSSCQAKQVVLLLDHSYSGEVIRQLNRANATGENNHSNLVAVSSGSNHQYSWDGGELTNQWTAFNHAHSCLHDFYYAASHGVRKSTPLYFDGSSNHGMSVTLTGAPCKIHPFLTDQELAQSYYGCQNLPARIWLTRLISSSSGSDPFR